MKWILIATSIFIFGLHGQDLDSLRSQKEQHTDVFKRTQKLLKVALKNKRIGIKQLNMFNLQIKQAQTIVQITEQELILIGSNIFTNQVQIKKFEKQLSILKQEYSQVISTLAKRNYYANMVLHLLASESFEQFFKRLNYLNLYRRTRTTQIQNIRTTNYKLTTYRQHLETMRQAKYELVESKIQYIAELNTLKEKETRLLERAAENITYLQKEILILEEQKHKFDSLVKLFTVPKAANFSADSILKRSKDFFKYQKQLIWPLSNPIVLQKFGRQKHPVLKNIWLDNLGLKIKSQQSKIVNNIFSGKIISVQRTYDFDYIVIIQHGRYFTVYSNLDSVRVSAGAALAQHQPIGVLGKDAELDFQIWHDNQKLDPEQWLLKQ